MIAFYTVVIGENAARCFSLAYKTLREVGKFGGPVFILTDEEREYTSYGSDIEQIIPRDDHLNLNPRSQSPQSLIDIRNFQTDRAYKFACCCVAPLIYKYVNITDYDWLVYWDIDILVTDLVSRLTDYLQTVEVPVVVAKNRSRRLWRFVTKYKIPLGWTRSEPCSANLSWWEIIKAGLLRPLCSCMVAWAGKKKNKTIIEDWLQECMKGIHGDQAALQAVLLRKYSDLYTFFPGKILGYGPGWQEYQANGSSLRHMESLFVHFQGAIRHPKAMEEYYAKYVNVG
ncbi:MAG: hypothetical protein ACLFWL_08445 [Candidatus Brocadiia bacterium]